MMHCEQNNIQKSASNLLQKEASEREVSTGLPPTISPEEPECQSCHTEAPLLPPGARLCQAARAQGVLPPLPPRRSHQAELSEEDEEDNNVRGTPSAARCAWRAAPGIRP